MDLMTRELMEEEPILEETWARELEESPESWLYYYGLPEYPPIRISTKDNQVFVRAEIPGMNLKDFEITVTGKSLKISGERKEIEETSCCLCSERSYGEFSRLISLPVEMDPNKVKATYSSGILTIEMTGREEVGARRVEVKKG